MKRIGNLGSEFVYMYNLYMYKLLREAKKIVKGVSLFTKIAQTKREILHTYSQWLGKVQNDNIY